MINLIEAIEIDYRNLGRVNVMWVISTLVSRNNHDNEFVPDIIRSPDVVFMNDIT